MEMSPYNRPVTATPRFTKAKKVLKLKLQIKWQAMRKAFRAKIPRFSRRTNRLSTIKIHHQELENKTKNKNVCRQPHSRTLGQLLLPRTASYFVDYGNKMTPTLSPKQDISTMWKQIHGSTNWDTLLDPLHPSVRQEMIKYGEFVQATYDAFDFDPLSEYCGSCRYNKMKLFDELGLTKHGYDVQRYIYAMSHVDVPEWLAKSYDSWSKDSNWMGYVAVSNHEESKRIGRRDIVVAWRGTVAPTEWYNDLRTKLELVDDNGDEDEQNDIKVQQGFLSIYKSKGESTRYNKASASEQVMQEVKKLVQIYRQNGEVSLTITGHSLGGALALLNAYEAATSIPSLFTSVISFGAPRVGNISFRKKLNELKVNTLRVVVKQDIVPKVPGIVLNTILDKVSTMTSRLNWVYRHVGTQLKLDVSTSPYLRRDSDIPGCHNLEVYLHLLDGYLGKKMNFRWNARRDLALVNKSSNMLVEKLRIPECWYEMPHKGLVLNKYGRWVKPSRQPEDVPSPSTMSSHNYRL